MIDIIPGDILLTRNADDVGNPTPGFWNHASVASINGWIIEAQEEPNAVIATPVDKFYHRYPQIVCLRTNLPLGTMAMSYVGKLYRKPASVFPRWRKEDLGENCVSVVRKSYKDAIGTDPKWKSPDNIYKFGFAEVWHKINYEDWKQPQSWFDGVTTDVNDILTIQHGLEL